MNLAQSLEKAARIPLAGISITDHLDIDAPGSKDFFIFDPAKQQEEINQYATIYPNLKIFKGIEVGLQECCIEKIK